jgi:hypothetical protein
MVSRTATYRTWILNGIRQRLSCLRTNDAITAMATVAEPDNVDTVKLDGVEGTKVYIR